MCDSVDTISEAFALQHEDMRLTHDLMGGTKAMLAAGERYIPREDGEEMASWNIRLHRTVLFNVYKRTLRYLGGRAFEKPVVLGEDAEDARYNDFVEDVDKQGHNLSVWSRHVFEEGLNDGVTFCVIDYSDVKTRRMNGATQYQLPDGTWADKTEAADRANGWGPYFIHVDARQVLDARMEWRSGKPIVTHFRYQETLEQPNGKWNTGAYQQIRAFFYDDAGRAAWQVWSNQDEDGDTAEFTMRDEGFFSIGVIPVVWFMPGEKRTPMTAEPALIDLAQLNKRHWQATSSQFEMMEYVRRPVWFGRRLGTRNTQTGEMKIVFGAGILCNADDDNAMLQSLGIDAGSVAAGRQELQDLENSMALYGLQLLQPKTGAITATESLRDAEENNSTLKAWALQFQDFLENCMRLVAKWWGQDDGPSVKVNTDFANAMDASFLLEMFRAQVISAQTFLELVKNMGILPDDFAVDDEAAKIAGGLMVNGGPGGVAGLAQRLRVGGI
mgnify:CR=1 FL=1